MSYQDEALNQLIINKLSKDQYNELAEAGTISANQLYFVESEGTIDADNGTIENVADPINNKDAANKQYVDNSIIEYSEDNKSYTDFEVSKKFSEVCYELAYINPSNSNYDAGSGYKGFITNLSSYTNSFIPENVTVHAISVSSEGNDTTVVDSYLSIFEVTVNNIEEAINLNSLDNYIYVGSSLNTNDVDGNPTEFIYVFNNIVLNKNKIYLFAFTSESDLSKYGNVDIFKDKLVGTRLKLLNGQSSESRMINTINSTTGIPTFRTDALIPVFKFYYNIKYNIDFVSSYVTDLSNSLSSYTLSPDVNLISSALNTDITYVSSQVSGIPNDITYVSSSLSGYAPTSDITYVSSQVSGIPLTITSLSSTVSSTYALKDEIPTSEDLGLSNYAAVSTVTGISNSLSVYSTKSDVTYVSSQVSGIPSDILDVSNSLSGYSTNADITYVSSQVSGLLPTVNDLTSTTENINNTLSSFVSYSTSSTLEFTPIQGMQYGTLSANADGISSYFTVGGNYGSRYKSFSLVGTDSPKLRFWSLYEESDFGEVLVSDLDETIYENGSITYNDNQLVFPEESGTFVVDSQLSAYSLSSDVTAYVDQQIGNINAILETI